MSRGITTFLTSRSPEVAWETVSKLLLEEDFVQRRVAKRLNVHEKTLCLWLRKHEYDVRVRQMRADVLAERVK